MVLNKIKRTTINFAEEAQEKITQSAKKTTGMDATKKNRMMLENNKEKEKVQGFEVVKIRSGESPSILCIDGFLTQDDANTASEWLENISTRYPNNEIQHVRWESENLRSAAIFLARFLSGTPPFMTVTTAVATISLMLLPISTWLIMKNNPWVSASNKAFATGKLLASHIIEEDKQYILVGHSLGARVTFACLNELKNQENKTYLKEVHLLGGAVNRNLETYKSQMSSKQDWLSLSSIVDGKIFNYFSKNDRVLQVLYHAGESLNMNFGDPIGRVPINSEAVEDIDVTDIVSGHTKYKENLASILSESS